MCVSAPLFAEADGLAHGHLNDGPGRGKPLEQLRTVRNGQAIAQPGCGAGGCDNDAVPIAHWEAPGADHERDSRGGDAL